MTRERGSIGVDEFSWADEADGRQLHQPKRTHPRRWTPAPGSSCDLYFVICNFERSLASNGFIEIQKHPGNGQGVQFAQTLPLPGVRLARDTSAERGLHPLFLDDLFHG